jgi:hypothetical protein
METVIILMALVYIPASIWYFVSQMMIKDSEIIKWQQEYVDLATELELVRLGVSK